MPYSCTKKNQKTTKPYELSTCFMVLFLYSRFMYGKNIRYFLWDEVLREPCCLCGLGQKLKIWHRKTVFCDKTFMFYVICNNNLRKGGEMPDRQRTIREQKVWERAEVTPNVFIMTHEFTHSVTPVFPDDCLAEGGGQAAGWEFWPLWYQASEWSLRSNSVSWQGQVISFLSFFFPERHSRTCSVQSLLQHADERIWLGQDTNQTAGQGQEILLHIIPGCNSGFTYHSQEANCVSWPILADKRV